MVHAARYSPAIDALRLPDPLVRERSKTCSRPTSNDDGGLPHTRNIAAGVEDEREKATVSLAEVGGPRNLLEHTGPTNTEIRLPVPRATHRKIQQRKPS